MKHPGRAAAAALGTLAGDAALEGFAHIPFANKAPPPRRHFPPFFHTGAASPETTLTTQKAAEVNIRSLSGSVPGTESAFDICSQSLSLLLIFIDAVF